MYELFTLHDAHPSNLEAINCLSHSEGFGVVEKGDTVRVALNEDGEVVGFMRLVFDDSGVCHINPVVVYSTWRRFGVGRALMNDALKRYGEVRLVSRGSSLHFYEALGYESCEWDEIKSEVAAECDECEMREECNPSPMKAILAYPEYGTAG